MHLPRLDVAGAARTSVIAPVSVKTVIKSWRIEVRTGPVTVCEWKSASMGQVEWSELAIAEGAPPSISGDADFTIQTFTSAILSEPSLVRGGSVSYLFNRTIRSLGAAPATSEALVIGTGSSDPVQIYEVYVRLEPAILAMPIKEGDKRLSLFWISKGRMFIVTGKMSSKVNPRGIASLIEIADSIE